MGAALAEIAEVVVVVVGNFALAEVALVLVGNFVSAVVGPVVAVDYSPVAAAPARYLPVLPAQLPSESSDYSGRLTHCMWWLIPVCKSATGMLRDKFSYS